ncbi:sugar transferase [Clostridium algidicarnis]|nr:sugar transferase [Clostridium algidicarnis]MBU3207619.1 sugar transferase [Clostridium algidicarnis]
MYIGFVKRLLDFSLSFIGLIILSPVFMVTAIFVSVKLGRPIIFKQSRPGLNEKIFTLYKFRTMTDEKNKHGDLLPDEIRLTKFGRFLRSTSLDELPQLINILKGDISIIGPRPLLVSYLPLYNDEQKRRHDIRPGLVGLAGVRGRNAQSWEEKFNYDIEYVNNLSFKLDCKIFLLALYTVFNRNGVNQEGEATTSPFSGDN